MEVTAIRALGLFSGGLDGLLAAVTLVRQGIDVQLVWFRTGFGRRVYSAFVEQIVERGGISAGPVELPAPRMVDVAERYLDEVVTKPRHGYGSGMNPCLDCRVFMLREAQRVADGCGVDLLFTGDVVGQRTMDQRRESLARIDREAGVERRVLRPLCARLMEPTLPEQDGRVHRERLGRVNGRTRRVQLQWARRLGLTGFPTASGGCCRLADRAYARRLRDHLAHGRSVGPDPHALDLLDVGRHFRISWQVKLVLGRNEAEAGRLAADTGHGWTCQAHGVGPFALVVGEPGPADFEAIASIVARYTRGTTGEARQIEFRRGAEARRVDASPATEDQLRRWRL